VGVKRSAEIDDVSGRRLGGNCEFFDWLIATLAVSRDGTMVI
jgi:hypothetical protein